MINRAKFDACTYSSFRGVKADRHTDRQIDRQNWALYIECVYLLLVASKLSRFLDCLTNLRFGNSDLRKKGLRRGSDMNLLFKKLGLPKKIIALHCKKSYHE